MMDYNGNVNVSDRIHYKESSYVITCDEYDGFEKIIDDYCRELLNTKYKFIIKIVLFIALIVVSFNLSNFFIQFKMVAFAIFFAIGKNIGEYARLKSFSKTAKEELETTVVKENIVYLCGCYPDEEFKKKYLPGFRCFIKLYDKYFIADKHNNKYRVSEKSNLPLYVGNPVKAKVIYTEETRLLLRIDVCNEREEIDNSKVKNEDSDKLNEILSRKDAEFTVRALKLPYINFKHREEAIIYMTMDVYYLGVMHLRGQRDINIILRSIKNELKIYIDELEKLEENSVYSMQEIVINILKEFFVDIQVTKVDFNWVETEMIDKRSYILL